MQEKRLLIVDDDSAFLNTRADLLDEKYEITKAYSSQQALDIISQTTPPFDCFVLDYNMPEMDGVTLAGEIRKNTLYNNAPIIIATGNNEIERIRIAREAEGMVNDVVHKKLYQDTLHALDGAFSARSC